MSRQKTLAAVRVAVADLLREKGCVTMVDVLVAVGRLTPTRVEDWRFGRVPYLERVVLGSLGNLAATLREVRAACEAIGLVPSVAEYRSWGRGPRRPLRFSASAAPAIERAYSTRWTSEAFRRGEHRERRAAAPPKAHPAVLQPGVRIEKDPRRSDGARRRADGGGRGHRDRLWRGGRPEVDARPAPSGGPPAPRQRSSASLQKGRRSTTGT